ncbi:TPA: hypothetical protein HA278_04300 [Candidatus Woesearchaeota archaeon]|jgi:formylmethanofuran dehydrogenase subunit E|nr:hypothetical protein [Candidatus Woesearchaeota archaeon]
MSNQITIQPTKFVNVRSGSSSLGVRVYDSYGQSYTNTWESIPDDDFEILKLVMELDDEVVRSMMDFIQEDQKTIDIGGAYYSWEEIKHLFLDDEEMINDDMFKCDKCNNWFSIDDSIQKEKEKLCVTCAEES